MISKIVRISISHLQKSEVPSRGPTGIWTRNLHHAMVSLYQLELQAQAGISLRSLYGVIA